MRCLLLATLIWSMTPLDIPAQPTDVAESSSRVPTCDTMYIGPPGGRWQNASNWDPFVPRPTDVVCVPADTVARAQGTLPFAVRTISTPIPFDSAEAPVSATSNLLMRG